MKRKMWAGILALVMVLSLMLSGCAGNDAGTSGKAKTLIYARGADPRGLDPAYVDDGESAKVIVNVYEGLVAYKADSTEIEPCLATDWDISEDGKEYIFHLRENVKFHDGTDFNADSVVFSVGRQLEGKRTSDMPYASFTFAPVESVEKIDNLTVKFVLSTPYTPFLANLAMSLAAPIVAPSAENAMEQPIGTGPFKFVKWDKEQAITLERNEDYWGEAPKLDKVIFKTTKENSVRASELMAGEVDIIDGVSFNDVDKLKENGAEIFQESGMNINYMAFNCERAPFDDAKLREAISHAINREEIATELYQGYSQVAKSFMPSFIPGYSEVDVYEYDPEKAKTMIKDLGKEDLEITIITYSNPRPYNPAGQKLAESIQGYLAKVGIKSNIVVYPWKEYKEKTMQGEGDIMFYGWIGDNGDPDNFLGLLDSREIESSLNAAKYTNKAVDALLDQGKSIPDGAERNEAYGDLQKLLAKDAPWLPLTHATSMAAYKTEVKGFRLHPTGVVYLKNVDKE